MARLEPRTGALAVLVGAFPQRVHARETGLGEELAQLHHRPVAPPVGERTVDPRAVGEREVDVTHDVVRERIEALTDADLFAPPSQHENFGIVVIEALACGTPVIVSDGVALHDEVVAANVGASVRVGDIPALASELDRWLDDDELRRATSQRARAFASEQFDWSKIAQRWRDHYRSLKVF